MVESSTVILRKMFKKCWSLKAIQFWHQRGLWLEFLRDFSHFPWLARKFYDKLCLKYCSFLYTGGGRVGTSQIGIRVIWLVVEPTPFAFSSPTNIFVSKSSNFPRILTRACIKIFKYVISNHSGRRAFLSLVEYVTYCMLVTLEYNKMSPFIWKCPWRTLVITHAYAHDLII